MKRLLTDKWKTHLLWLIILLIFCGIIYGKQKSINSFKSQMQKFQLDNLAFEEEINEKGQRIVSQEQIILSQKDAIEQGLLDIDKLKKVQSQVNVVTETIIDTFVVSHTDTIVQYIEGDAFLKLPHTYNYYTEHLNFGAEISSQGLKVNNISILNTSTITIGYKNNGLFRKSTPIVELKNSNPYVQTNSVGNVVIKENKSLIENPKVWGGLGLFLGLLIN
tara:strand:+ start:998 stop:1657 length:660 start_codon:yes stop_codon:yes gene_type:complete